MRPRAVQLAHMRPPRLGFQVLVSALQGTFKMIQKEMLPAHVERRTLKGGGRGHGFARGRGRSRGSTGAHNAAAVNSHGHWATALSAAFLAGAILVPV